MSDWGDHEEGWPEPVDVDEHHGKDAPQPAPAETLHPLVAADPAVETGMARLRTAQAKLRAAEDALADADDAIVVAEAKAEDYRDDDSKKPHQVTAAERDVAKRTRARARAAESLTSAQADIDHARRMLAAAVVEAEAAIERATLAPPAPEEPELYYGSVDEFVREYLCHAYKRKIDGNKRVWAARWWEVDEAIIRLEALWRSWEFLRRDPATGMSVWWRDHADHHMGVLMDPQGPFAAADILAAENLTRKGEPLPYAAPPEGLFPDVREQPPSDPSPDVGSDDRTG